MSIIYETPVLKDMDSLRTYEDFILKENNMERVSIKRDSSNLFLCLSYHLYNSENNEETLQRLCISYLNILIQTNALPRRLQLFMNNAGLLKNYVENINHSSFDLVNLELISLFFKRMIYIYEIDDKTFLNCRIINGHFGSPLKLFSDKFNNYDCLITLNHHHALAEIRNLTMQIIENALEGKSKGKKDSRRDSDSFFDQLNDDIKKFSMETDENEFDNTTNNMDPVYPIISYNPIGALPQNPIKSHNLLKLQKPLPKIKIDFTKDMPHLASGNDLINEKNDVNFPDFKQEGFDAYENNNIQRITPLTFTKTADDPHPNNFTWDGEVLNDQSKTIHSFPNFCTYNYSFQTQPYEYYPLRTTNDKMPMNIAAPNLAKNKPLVLEESSSRFMGTLKFFDENKSFGFIIMDVNNSEIFFHFDDFDQTGVTKEMLMTYKNGNIIRLSFGCLKYIGKYNISLKAVEIKLVSMRKAK